MFSREAIIRKLLGCFEVFLLMPVGIKRFEGSRAEAIKSFVIPIVLLPFIMIVLVAMSPGYSVNLLVLIHLIRIIVTVILGLAAVYFLAMQFGKVEYFYKFLNVSNWYNIPSVIFLSPIIFAFMMGYDMGAMESYAVFLTLIGVLYSSFVITHVFKLPWELGGFIAIVCLAIDQNVFGFALYIRDWVSI
ncbi:MAG: hypothetical protein ACRBDI_04300 [Alphaproteobacteria bacterium]